jgi:hypothetical protein
MTILSVYVYSPLSGTITGRDYYCQAGRISSAKMLLNCYR